MAAKPRPLNRERILNAALAMADADGLAALSMRKLGQRVGVEAMSLYNHVANKDELLDGLLDLVIAEIALPAPGEPWREGMYRRVHSAREMFLRHPWALQLMETRKNPGPAHLRYYDAVIGCLRESGFSLELTAHAFAVLDSYLFGFVLQEFKLQTELGGVVDELATEMAQKLPVDVYPYFSEMVAWHAAKPGYRFGDQFDWGLALVLDGLAAQRAREVAAND